MNFHWFFFAIDKKSSSYGSSINLRGEKLKHSIEPIEIHYDGKHEQVWFFFSARQPSLWNGDLTRILLINWFSITIYGFSGEIARMLYKSNRIIFRTRSHYYTMLSIFVMWLFTRKVVWKIACAINLRVRNILERRSVEEDLWNSSTLFLLNWKSFVRAKWIWMPQVINLVKGKRSYNERTLQRIIYVWTNVISF